MIFKKRRRSQKEKIWSKVQSTNILAWPIARTSCPAHLWYFNYQCREYIRHHPVYRIRTSAWNNFTWTSKNDSECRNGAKEWKTKLVSIFSKSCMTFISRKFLFQYCKIKSGPIYLINCGIDFWLDVTQIKLLYH